MLLGGGGSGAVGTAIISCGRARSGVVLLGGVFLQLAGVCPVAYCYMWPVSLNLCLRCKFSDFCIFQIFTYFCHILVYDIV